MSTTDNDIFAETPQEILSKMGITVPPGSFFDVDTAKLSNAVVESKITGSTPEISTINVIDGLPQLYADDSFRTYSQLSPEQRDKYNVCYSFAHGEGKKQSIFLAGEVGNGKTHLAVSIMKHLAPRTNIDGNKVGNKCKFMIADEFFCEINDAVYMRKSKVQFITELFNKYDVICLDDLGVSNFTEAKKENLYMFLNRAYLDKHKIIITTNFTLEELRKHDPRIASRISEMCQLVRFEMPDYRTKSEKFKNKGIIKNE